MRPSHRSVRRARRGNRAGFSLISVVVALVLLLVGIAALARTQMEAIRSQRGDAGRGQALALASAYMEELRARDIATIASEALVAIDSLGNVSGTGRFQRQVIVSNDAANLIRVTVQVTPPGAGQPVSLLTLFYRRT